MAIGGIGEPHARDARLRAAIAKRLDGAPAAPILVLGDVFERAGLVGFCNEDPNEPARASQAGCDARGSVDAQFDAILGPYARSFAGHPLVALAGSADHAGDPEATANACARIGQATPGWRYVARGCELGDAHGAARLDAGALALVLLDSEAMLLDSAFRARALDALHAELAALRQERPDAWLVLALYHPLESYGAHNGADLATAAHKDFYPWFGAFASLFSHPSNPYEWGVRGLRSDLYRALAESPVDAVISGQDESLQLVELDHPGARWQIVSGAGSQKSHVKQLGLDWAWSNRAARALGLGGWLPAVRHELVFAAGRGDDATRSGYGFATLSASPERLRVEFWDLARATPLGVAELARAGHPPQRGEREDQ
ncbi:MAG TPA: hypothetical protein VEN47_06105 [Myxococcota bacterium]|nr:hypothetical protein [Myxococcota bacterium]